MKKLLLSISLLLGVIATSQAQSMIAYGFETTNSPLTLVTDGTNVPVDYTGEDFSGLVITGDGELNSEAVTSGQGFPIGFNFNYDGKEMNQFAIGTDGAIYLGKDNISVGQETNAFLTFKNDNDNFGIVAIGGMFGLDSTEISYKNYEENGQQVLLIQYHNLGVGDRWGDAAVADADIQYRLYADGTIQFKVAGFKPYEGASLKHCSLKMGIHGTGDDRLMVTAFDGSSTSASDRLVSYSADSYPADGTTYTFTAPEPCSTPTTQGSALQLSSTSQAISGSFTSADDADHYLVLVSKDEPTALPVDRTQYSVGDSLGNALVAANVSDTTFATNDILTSSTNYKVNVYSYNSRCLNGPLYNTTSPLSGEIKTLAGAPSALNVVSTDSAQITLSVVADPEQPAIILYTDSPAQDSWGESTGEGAFGTPTGTYSVGDEVEGGGKVAYIGQTSDNVVVDGLTPSTTYYFRAYSTDGTGNYSSLYTDASGSTATKVPYHPDFSEYSVGDTPAGWTAVGDWTVTRNGTVQNGLRTTPGADGLVQSLTTPAVYLGENANRVKTQLSLSEYKDWSYNAYTFVDGDTLAIQVSHDGENFTNIQTFTGENGTAAFAGGRDSYVTVMPVFTDYAGQKAYVRIYFRTHGITTLTVGDFLIEQKPDCDYPVNVRDSVINGGNATLTWDLQGEEGTWEYSYKKSSDSEWGDSFRVNERVANLEGLDGLTKYDFRVRAVCDQTHHSEWSDVFTFRTGAVVPFDEDFTQESDDPGWTSYSGVLADPTILEPGRDFRFYNSSRSGAYVYFSNYNDSCDSWYVSPKFNLDDNGGKQGVQITFKAGQFNGPYSGTETTDQQIYVVLSHDGENFNTADTVAVINLSDFKDIGYQDATWVTDTLKGYNGPSMLGIYTKTRTGQPYSFNIDEIAVNYVALPDEPVIDAIDKISANADEESSVEARYNAAGQLIKAPQRGLNIVRMKDGTVKKVLVK